MSVRIREQTPGLEILSDREPAPATNWRKSLADAVRNVDELCDLLGLPNDFRLAARESAKLFPLVVPRRLLSLMRPGDPTDPILRQFLPLAEEGLHRPGFTNDPVGDLAARSTEGMLQKYSRRALLITTGVCAVHCRYCFRRHYPYGEEPRGLAQWEPALELLAGDPTIDEVILSGGDPLTLTDDFLGRLADRLNAIGHLTRLRIHSRLPIVLPERVTQELLAWLTTGRLTPIVVVHANHPRELAPDVEASLSRLVDGGAAVFNQAVLLRGINDDANVLEELCRRLVNLRVIPYYLHAVPKYVQEVEGQPHKLPIDCME
jgi:EF-P beta-lysylation protein EpmB